VKHLLDSLTLATGSSVLVVLVAIWYLLGHLLLWIARSFGRETEEGIHWAKRLCLALCLQVPKPSRSFDPQLEQLFDAVTEKFRTDGVNFAWRQFYPVVRSYLAQRLKYSLVETYQNKYTLHRSVMVASATLCWLSLLALLGGLIISMLNGPAPNWIFSFLLLGLSTVFVWAFSSSYAFYWQMFGNTIITEAYAILYAPRG